VATRAPSLAERLLERLEWHVVRRVDGLLQGDYRTLLYGDGIDFADLREYQPYDDVRRIDWNVTARMDAPYVRQYVDDRELTAWLLLDRSPSMRFGHEDRTKEAVLAELVAVLSRLFTRGGNRVGAVLANDQVERVIAPRSGRNQVLRLTRDVLAPLGPSRATTDLRPLLNAGAHAARRRSLIVIVSDFISEPGWERAIGLLAQRHEAIAVRLWDRREVDLPDAGVVALEDAETGEQLFVDTSDPVLRRRVREHAATRLAALRGAMKRAGVDLFDISTDDDLARALVRIVELRKARRS
jgi:uncharacterized protein (DUF58 family)